MTPYKTNSSLYLDYLASVRTREQIEADPRLCVYLNNPYIKDNMEIALRYNAAKTGDYAAKMEFVEYLMCNGPELDADTIMHYRTKISLDPICEEIAYSYYSDPNYVMDIRETKYGKKKNAKDNCFNNPCSYMGRFSSGIGKHATLENAKSMWNCVAESLGMTAEEKQEQKTKMSDKVSPDAPEGGLSIVAKALTEATTTVTGFATSAIKTVKTLAGLEGGEPLKPDRDKNPNPSPIPVERHLWGWIPTTIKNGWGGICSLCTANFKDACDKLGSADNLDAEQYGDPLAAPFAKKTEIMTYANIKRQMGDCSRLWDQMRRIDMYNPAQNATAPIPPSQVPGDVGPNGLDATVSSEDTPVVTIQK